MSDFIALALTYVRAFIFGDIPITLNNFSNNLTEGNLSCLKQSSLKNQQQ
uniref:Uncharacterized protein n=1 Tax=Podoviridae sp. ctBev14 TaxID=2823556 RepID=A0A8S5LAQ7_9CAUD|nr:MAG TPA: hypothetical protein [Podoviridae sp. ctBev14]